MRKIPTFKKILGLSLFFLASSIFASPLANPNNISNQTTTMYPTVIRGIPGTGLPFGNLLSSLQQYILIYNTTPGSYNQSIDLQPFLQTDPRATLVIYIAGAQGESESEGSYAYIPGSTGGITVLMTSLSKFIQTFGNTVNFNYTVGGISNASTGQSVVYINQTPIAIAGGGQAFAGFGGGGGGGNDPGNGGGNGYCDTSLGSCQASDWTNGGGNYGNGYVYVYIQP